MPSPRLIPLGGARPLVAAVLLLAAFAASARAPAAEPTPRLTQVCLGCHAGQDTLLAGTPHQLPPGAPDGARLVCTDCHTGDARHWEGEPQEHPMSNPAEQSPSAAGLVCATCHQSAHQQDMTTRNVHARNGLNCGACHRVHGEGHPPLLKAAENDLCLSCHTSVSNHFARSFRHPVPDGVLRCGECHENMGATARNLERTRDEICTRCHGEFDGPFPHEHQATLGFSTEEGGCLACHEAHGSEVPRLLKQPLEGPSFQLCSQCHLVPGHQFNSFHGSQWAGMPCNECHADIHGSFVSRRFFSESMQGLGCFNAGCHQF